MRSLRFAQGPGGQAGRPSRRGRREGSCIFGGKQSGDGGFPSRPAPECLCFLSSVLVGFQPREGEVRGRSPRHSPKPRGAQRSRLCCVDGCVCAEGEARPQPRTTHNSVHSGLSFVPSLLPEEASAMARPSAAGPRRAGGCVSEHHAVSSHRGAGHAGRAAQSSQRLCALAGSALPPL